MNADAECTVCGGRVRRHQGSYDLSLLQMPGVVLHGIDLVTCEACGNVDPVIPQLSRILQVAAVARIRKPFPLSGEDVRSLRTYLNRNRCRFASLLHVAEETVDRW